ncbi:c-type cytochrome [Acidisoma sp.]|uniref:c-type cytochrome n=1 Tax=Acidisoma sp. TaxID=1872115 RepID=UPI003B001341
MMTLIGNVRSRRQAGRQIVFRAGATFMLLCAPFAAAAAASDTTSSSALPTLFTSSEADQGRIVFEQHCAACHGEDLRGKIGPALVGPSLGSARDHTTISIMFNVIAFEMPAGAPASLTKENYAVVMAYILQRNGYPADAHPLSYTSAETLNTPLISQVR